MKKGFFSAIALLLVGIGVVSAQDGPAKSAAALLPPSPPTNPSPTATDARAEAAPDTGTNVPAQAANSTAVQTPPLEGCNPLPALEFSRGRSLGRVWASAEYLMWWTKAQPLPTPVLSSGALDQPTSSVFLGGESPLGLHMRHGGRFTLGAYLDDEQRFGLEGNYFFLGNHSDGRTLGSNGTADSHIDGFPFNAIFPGGQQQESFFTLANPGLFSNQTFLSVSSFLQGYEINGSWNVRSDCTTRISLLAGYRYLDLQEQLNLLSMSPPIPTNPQGVTFNVYDEFGTRNQFYGGQLGIRAVVDSGRFFGSATGKVAVGGMHQTAVNSGQFEQYSPTIPYQLFPGGFYTQPTNIGHFSRDRLAWMPEVTVNAGARLSNHLSAFVGYNFLWVSSVLRPGDQIDRNINPTQIQGGQLVGPARPGVPFNDSTFWAQGINFGLQLNW